MKKVIFSQKILIVMILLLFSFLSITNSCKKATDIPGANEVLIQGMAFSPGTITVPVNTTITWTNKDPNTHTVTSNTGIFDSGSISNNGTWSHTFATAGIFPYHCKIHTSMTATVIVN
jgi:plastocyanin